MLHVRFSVYSFLFDQFIWVWVFLVDGGGFFVSKELKQLPEIHELLIHLILIQAS